MLLDLPTAADHLASLEAALAAVARSDLQPPAPPGAPPLPSSQAATTPPLLPPPQQQQQPEVIDLMHVGSAADAADVAGAAASPTVIEIEGEGEAPAVGGAAATSGAGVPSRTPTPGVGARAGWAQGSEAPAGAGKQLPWTSRFQPTCAAEVRVGAEGLPLLLLPLNWRLRRAKIASV